MKDENFTPLSYEASVRYLIEKSNKRAWLVAFCSLFTAICAVIAVAFITPLKTVEPYVIRVDNITGAVDIITSVNEEEFTSSEAIDKYFVAQYVKLREGYFYNMLEKDYILVQIYSAPNIAADYRTIYEGDDARQEKLKNLYEVDIDINSVVLGDSMQENIKTATIRFNQIIKNVAAEQSDTMISKKTKIVTLAYEYSPKTLSDEDERLKNPLGFKVVTYRIDDEIQR